MTDTHVSTIFINATCERVWAGLTGPEFTRQYFHQTTITSNWTVGDSVTYLNPDGSVAVAGEVLEANHPTLLSFTWHVRYNEKARREPPSRVRFELTAVGDATKLVLIHDQFTRDSVVYPQIREGWIAILSNLKTLLETGEVMSIS